MSGITVRTSQLRHDCYATTISWKACNVPEFGPTSLLIMSDTNKKIKEQYKMMQKREVEKSIEAEFATMPACGISEQSALDAMRKDSRAVALNDGMYLAVDGTFRSLLNLGFKYFAMPPSPTSTTDNNYARAPLESCAEPEDCRTFAIGQIGYHTTADQLFKLFTEELLSRFHGESAPIVCVSEGDRKSRRTGVWFVTVPAVRAAEFLSLHHRVIFGDGGAYVSPSERHADDTWFKVLEFVALRNCYAQRVKPHVPSVHDKFKTGAFLMTVEKPRT